MTRAQQEERCVPGDVTVTKIPAGFLIGRALEREGRGPWWEYIGTVVSFRQAVLRGHKLANKAGVHAWLHVSGTRYEPLPKWKPRPRRRARPKAR